MLSLNSVSYEVAGHLLFKNISFAFTQQRYGMVGPNGVGKSTLAKILAGKLSATSGYVQKEGSVIYFSQTEAADNILLSDYLSDIWDSPYLTSDFAIDALDSLELSQKTSELSGGEWTRARLLKALTSSCDFLILDEPSNNLDLTSKKLIRKFIQSYAGGLLLISHDRELLCEVETILELSNQGLSIYGGDFTFYYSQRTLERERHENELSELKRNKKKRAEEQVQKIQKQERRMKRGAEAAVRGGMPKILLGARKRAAQVSRGKVQIQTDELSAHAHEQVASSWALMKNDPFFKLNFKGAKAPNDKILLSTEDLNWQFKNSNYFLWKKSLNFTIKGSERWHISGSNGAGKSTLIKILLEKINSAGSLHGQFKNKAQSIGYLDQGYGQLSPDQTLLENIMGEALASEADLRNELAQYGFTGDSVYKKVSRLSGGELLKASLAKIFIGKSAPDLLVLDEPTNNLDLQSLELLEAALRQFQGALVVISHDAYFLENLMVSNCLDLDSFK